MDFAILHWIHDTLACPVLDALMVLVTTLGDHGAIWIVVGIILLIPARTRRWGVTLLVTMGLTWLICELGVKNIICRERPFMVDPSIGLLISAPSGFSMPSGHTLTSFCAATVLSRAPVARGFKIAGWVMAALIAFSRLYLFVHFPTDVLVGIAIGIAAGLLGSWVSNVIARGRTTAR